MMKGKGFMDKNMNVGMKDFRPERMKVERILHEEFPDLEIRLEFPVNNLKIDGHPCAGAVLDIAILGYKVAIRMMGEIHQWSKKSRVKDQYQLYALEEAGWQVIDFIKDEFPAVWNKSKKEVKLNEAKKEVLDRLRKEKVAFL